MKDAAISAIIIAATILALTAISKMAGLPLAQ
jgi:hypothetical protein